MITQYTLHNFKNHDTTTIPMEALTILTGMNGTGKSSIIQSMMILRESMLNMMLPDKLYLKGNSFKVGKSNDILNGGTTKEGDLLSMKIEDETKQTLLFEFSYPKGKSVDSMKATKNSSRTKVDDIALETGLFSDDFQYISASRLGPSDSYNIDTDIVDEQHQISHRMGQGEYAVYYLEHYGNDDIANQELAHEDSDDLSLKHQVECWMNEISDGVKITTARNGDKVELKYGYARPGKPTQYHSAWNSGYGLSYVISILVAVLSAKKGALIFIENPEAHIHPAGQSSLMHLIGLASKCGVQIVIESHSDHIINGALVMAKETLGREHVRIIYFTRDDNLNSEPLVLEIEPHGRIINAPDGFCDQMELDMDKLFEM